jgi:hypothetical protein
MKYGTGNGASILFCGRRIGRDLIPGSDGRCGPNNGPQCSDCLATSPPYKFPSTSYQSLTANLKGYNSTINKPVVQEEITLPLE